MKRMTRSGGAGWACLGAICLISLTTVLTGCSSLGETVTEKEVDPDVVQISQEAVEKVGLDVLTLTESTSSGEMNVLGEVKAKEDKLFHISSLVQGRVVQASVVLGDFVQQGQTLAVIQNLEVVKIQADSIHDLHANDVSIQQAKVRLGLAEKNLAREKRLLEAGVSPRKDYLQAEADALIARSELAGLHEHNTHITSEARSLLGTYGVGFNPKTETLNSASPVVAPRSGVVIKKNIALGDVVSPEKALYEVADLSQVWLDLTLYPKDVSAIRVGQVLQFVSDSLPDKTFMGRVNYIQPGASETSQSFVARAYLANPKGVLKPGMFGQATVQLGVQETLPLVPDVAVQKYGKETFVFVPQGKGRYKKTNLVLGDKVTGGYLVIKGIKTGEKVVGKGSFTLKSEMLKSQFGED